MLFHLCIVGIFDVSQMNEPGTNISGTTNEKTKNQNVVYNLLSLSSYHNLFYLKGYE